ncbi:hypothetical protein JOB18_010926 [Solea senegalensis]|uniref:Uncharacterized protein n=1 Tax=Solea senegalensis TaxID=28829 RepID=A0AAV6R4A6_SOLSE|nr:hypothetical protein JOB18_010926 [Solea senegalensis]
MNHSVSYSGVCQRSLDTILRLHYTCLQKRFWPHGLSCALETICVVSALRLLTFSRNEPNSHGANKPKSTGCSSTRRRFYQGPGDKEGQLGFYVHAEKWDENSRAMSNDGRQQGAAAAAPGPSCPQLTPPVPLNLGASD